MGKIALFTSALIIVALAALLFRYDAQLTRELEHAEEFYQPLKQDIDAGCIAFYPQIICVKKYHNNYAKVLMYGTDGREYDVILRRASKASEWTTITEEGCSISLRESWWD